MTSPPGDVVSRHGAHGAVNHSMNLNQQNKALPSHLPMLVCYCAKSKCTKRYCECYAAGVKCTPYCQCVGCENC